MRRHRAFQPENRHFIGTAYLLAGEFENAVKSFHERIQASPNTDLTRGFLVSALGHLGRVEEARAIREELRGINPKYSFAEHVGRLPLQNKDRALLMDGYAKAGIDD